MNETDDTDGQFWRKVAKMRGEKVADILELLGVEQLGSVETPVLEARKAVDRIRRDARNAALEEAERRIKAILDVLLKHGQVEGAHHKAWVIDQVLRRLADGAYADVVAMYERSHETEWQTGVAP